MLARSAATAAAVKTEMTSRDPRSPGRLRTQETTKMAVGAATANSAR